MCKTAVGLIHKEHSDIVAPVGLERLGSCIGMVSQPLCDLPYLLLGLPAYVAVVIQRLGNRGDRNSAGLRYVF